MTKQKMTAKKKAKLSALIGIVLGVVVGMIPNVQAMNGGVWEPSLLVLLLIYPPIFMLYSFGYVFGWARTKRWAAAAFGVSADIMFFSILLQIICKKGLAGGTVLAILILSFAIGLAWIPGVFQGIAEMHRERKLAVE